MRWVERDKAERCPQCDTKESDWMAPDPKTGKMVDLREPAYRAVIRHCSGCEELDEMNGEHDRKPGDHPVLAPNLGDVAEPDASGPDG